MAIQGRPTHLAFRLVALLALTAVACGDELPGDPAAASVIQQHLGISGGGVPIPAEEDANGRMQITWNGSYAELLAADAYAGCNVYGLLPTTPPVPGEYVPQEADLFLNHLMASMNMALCTAHQPNDPVEDEAVRSHWVQARQDPRCNVDPLTAAPGTVDVAEDWGISPIELAPAYIFDAFNLVHGGDGQETEPYVGEGGLIATDRDTHHDVTTQAFYELLYAHTSLCIAERLREHVDSVQVAFASEEELVQVLTFIRERTLTAAYQYALLARAFGLPSQPGDHIVSHPRAYLPAFAALREIMRPEAVSDFGRDFSLAVARLTDATAKHNELLFRKSQAQRQLADWSFEADGTYLSGPRVDATDLSYGTNAGRGNTVTTTDMNAPEIEVLLGLARQAGALNITFTALAAETQVDIGASAADLFSAVEFHYRTLICPPEATDANCAAVPTDELRDHFIYKRLKLTQTHARRLVAALVEQLYGAPPLRTAPSSDGEVWHYGADALRPQAGARVQGDHTLGTSTLRVDSNFQLSSNDVRDMQGRASVYLPPSDWHLAAHPTDVGFGFRTAWLDEADRSGTDETIRIDRHRRPIGSIPALAFARETLATLGIGLGTEARAKLSGIVEASNEAVRLIDAAIGQRALAVRPAITWNGESSNCQVWEYFDASSGALFEAPATCVRPVDPTLEGPQNYHLTLLTHPDDTMSRVAAEPQSTPLAQLPTAPSAVGGALTDRTGSLLTGSLLKEGTFPATAGNIHAVVLHESSGADDGWEYAFAGVVGDTEPFTSPLTGYSRVITQGGFLNQQLGHAWLHRSDNWSKPHYDAFGLPTDWTPSSDAALHGGHEGEETYQYFLKIADTAAREAGTAIDVAFENLSAEVHDDLARQSAEERGGKLIDHEIAAVCGVDRACAASLDVGNHLSHATVDFYIPQCPTLDWRCDGYRDLLAQRLFGAPSADERVTILVAAPVAEAIEAGIPNPSFDRYAGGELQSLFQQQWSAYKDFTFEAETAVQVFASIAAQTVAIDQDRIAAETDFEAAIAEGRLAVQQFLFQTGMQEAELQARIGDYEQRELRLEREFNLIAAEYERACSETALADAVRAGLSRSGPGLHVYHNGTEVIDHGDNPCRKDGGRAANSDGICIAGANGASWNAGPLLAARDRCGQAGSANGHWQNIDEEQELLAASLSTFEALVSDLPSVQLGNGAFAARIRTASQRRKAALKRGIAEQQAVSARMHTSFAAVRATMGRLAEGAGRVETVHARGRRSLTEKRMEQSLAFRDIKARFGLRRQFRSYDLWRARALSENARRLAVAARRAIESRFVVDLSKMAAPEPFVEAPNVWADDIYASDLKPPSALGRTAGPTPSSGPLGHSLYSNQLVDYVRNLQLFVNGYAVQRPTASVKVDTEVIQLTGPGATVTNVNAGVVHREPDPKSAGWTFYCPRWNRWLPHNPEEPAASLNTLCVGERPTWARLAFSLDPWGRTDGYYARPPYTRRHNVRWRQLSMNLVGAGIRDCGSAVDSTSCYAEPFTRYDLRHVGPSMVTNYGGEWQSQNIPTGYIEGGKALASEEWVDPVINSFNAPGVANVSRMEYAGRPIGGAYELMLEIGPDVRLDRIQRVQLLTQTEYWVRQGGAAELDDEDLEVLQCPEDYQPPTPEWCAQQASADACTYPVLQGHEELCNVECVQRPITRCIDGDGCCPDGCTVGNDSECRDGTALPMPLQIADISAWWRADFGITLDAQGRVQRWADQGTGAYNAAPFTESARPLYSSQHPVWNGRPTLRFQHAQELRVDALAPMFTGYTPWTVVYGVQYGQAGGRQAVWSIGTSGVPEGDHRYYAQGTWGGNYLHHLDPRVGLVYVTPVAVDTLPNVHAVSFDGTRLVHRVNGQPMSFVNREDTWLANSFIHPNMFSIGSGRWWPEHDAVGAYLLNGTLPEMMFYSRALETSEIEQLEHYMMERYGLQEQFGLSD